MLAVVPGWFVSSRDDTTAQSSAAVADAATQTRVNSCGASKHGNIRSAILANVCDAPRTGRQQRGEFVNRHEEVVKPVSRQLLVADAHRHLPRQTPCRTIPLLIRPMHLALGQIGDSSLGQ